MRYIKRICVGVMVLTVSVGAVGSLWAAHGGGMGGGGFHGGMGGGGFHGATSGGFHGAMGNGFHSSMSGSRSFASPSFNSGFHSFSYSTQHFAASPRINNSFASHVPSMNNGLRAQPFGFHDNQGFHNTVQHPVNPSAWTHNGNWWRNNQAWNHNFAWNHGHDYDRHFDHFHSVGFFPYWYPFGWHYWPYYSSYGYPYYSYYDYGYSPYSYYGYDPGYYSYEPTYDSGTYVTEPDAYMTEGAYAPETEQYPAIGEETTATPGDWSSQFLTSAREAFRSGDYSDALRLASHAAVESPKDAKAHELMSLAMFAFKDYRGANVEAHEALALGPPADWPTLYRYYEDLPTYSKQLDSLADYTRDHQDAMDARFVLAYHNLMMGHKDAAKTQLEAISAKMSKDRVAGQLLRDLGGTRPVGQEKTTPAASTAERPASGGEKTR
jgi:hypothetical protein